MYKVLFEHPFPVSWGWRLGRSAVVMWQRGCTLRLTDPSPNWLPQWTVPPATNDSSRVSTSFPMPVVFDFISPLLVGVWVWNGMSLWFLLIYFNVFVGPLFIFPETCLSDPLPTLLGFLLLSGECSYTFHIYSLQIFSPFHGASFLCLIYFNLHSLGMECGLFTNQETVVR